MYGNKVVNLEQIRDNYYHSKHLINQRQQKELLKEVWHVDTVIAVALMSSLLTFNIYYTFSSVSIADFVQVNVSWDYL